jgi:hypothetical protein
MWKISLCFVGLALLGLAGCASGGARPNGLTDCAAGTAVACHDSPDRSKAGQDGSAGMGHGMM